MNDARFTTAHLNVEPAEKRLERYLLSTTEFKNLLTGKLWEWKTP